MRNSKEIFRLIPILLEDEELTYLDKTVFFGLISFNGLGKMFPTREVLGRRITCCNVSSISKSLNKLKRRGYIKIHRRKHQSSIYEFCFSKIGKTKSKVEAVKPEKTINKNETSEPYEDDF